jgi:hypothetical protein
MAKQQKTPPVPDPTHKSLKPDGGKTNKGSYYRRLEDIGKGLKEIDKSKMPTGGRFLFLYYGCEKLGKGIVGIAAEWKADDAYEQDRNLHLHELKAAAGKIGLDIPDAALNGLFVGKDKKSARYWRNEIAHNLGPSNVENVVKHSAVFNMRMHEFLDTYTPAALKFLSVKYAHLMK